MKPSSVEAHALLDSDEPNPMAQLMFEDFYGDRRNLLVTASDPKGALMAGFSSSIAGQYKQGN